MRWVEKKVWLRNFGDFCADLKKIWFFRVMLGKFRLIRCDRPFSGRTNVFPAILILQMLSPFIYFQIFFKNFWRAGRAREITSPQKTSIFFECCKQWPQQKNFFAEMAKKNIWTDRNFWKLLLAIRIWYYVKKKGPCWCHHARILQYFMFMLLYVHQSFFEIWRWLIYGKTSIFDGECDETKN